MFGNILQFCAAISNKPSFHFHKGFASICRVCGCAISPSFFSSENCTHVFGGNVLKSLVGITIKVYYARVNKHTLRLLEYNCEHVRLIYNNYFEIHRILEGFYRFLIKLHYEMKIAI